MLQTDREIVVSRVIDAPRALVFAAWTDPEHLSRWWGPNGFSGVGCTLDLRVGGSFAFQMRGPDGLVYPCEGVFEEILPPERLVYSGVAEGDGCGGGIPPRATVTVTFAEHGKTTAVTIHTRLDSVADRDAAEKMGFIPGWSQCLERLARELEQVPSPQA